MAIYDAVSYHVNIYWLWTAITRAQSLDDIYFNFGDTNKNSQKEEQKIMIDNYLQSKIIHYRHQDKKAGREISIDEPYVSTEWLKSCFSSCCSPDCATARPIRI